MFQRRGRGCSNWVETVERGCPQFNPGSIVLTPTDFLHPALPRQVSGIIVGMLALGFFAGAGYESWRAAAVLPCQLNLPVRLLGTGSAEGELPCAALCLLLPCV